MKRIGFDNIAEKDWTHAVSRFCFIAISAFAQAITTAQLVQLTGVRSQQLIGDGGRDGNC
jgi:hypothetical protein